MLARFRTPRPVTVYDRIGGHEAIEVVVEIIGAIAPLASEIATGEADNATV